MRFLNDLTNLDNEHGAVDKIQLSDFVTNSVYFTANSYLSDNICHEQVFRWRRMDWERKRLWHVNGKWWSPAAERKSQAIEAYRDVPGREWRTPFAEYKSKATETCNSGWINGRRNECCNSMSSCLPFDCQITCVTTVKNAGLECVWSTLLVGTYATETSLRELMAGFLEIETLSNISHFEEHLIRWDVILVQWYSSSLWDM